MATQIFIEPELENLEVAETAAEWFEICSQLGLECQLKHADKSEEKKAPPYMAIDPKTQCIIRALCPRKVSYDDYSHSTIPLDVLQEIQKCVTNGWYKSISIFYDDRTPDPFVVGSTEESAWNGSHHLIARWGAELLPFEQLEEKAIQRLKNAAERAIHKLSAEIDFARINTTEFVRSMLGGDQPPVLDFRISNLHW